MKTKTVMVPLKIPVGYDLAKGEQPRKGVDGEVALDWCGTGTFGVIEACGETQQLYYILVKEWEPTSEKAYMVSNHIEDVGTSKGCVIIFKRMVDGQYVDAEGVQWERCYADAEGLHWEHCWPIPADMIGE